MKAYYDVIVVGSGPAGLGAAFHVAEHSKKSVLVIDRAKISSGGLRNDCKQNYTFPVCFPVELWEEEEANELLEIVARHLHPEFENLNNISIYANRAEKLGVRFLVIRQAHVGTDRAAHLIGSLIEQLRGLGVEVLLNTEMTVVDDSKKEISLKGENAPLKYGDLVIAPGRWGYKWLQERMDDLGVPYKDNIVDIGIRVETGQEHYAIVKDYYDPKFIFPTGVRTFCTNSGAAYVVKEKYDSYYSINGHSFSNAKKPNGLVNFALLKSIMLTDPVISGQLFADALGRMAMQLGGGFPMMQRIGDFRMGKRSKVSTFNEDLYNFKATLSNSTPGDIGLAMPSKIMRDIWKSLKMLDTIVPGVLHPSTIIYYPEIKTYANRPGFVNRHFMVKDHIYIIGDGAGTSRGITAAWASGIRAALGILSS